MDKQEVKDSLRLILIVLLFAVGILARTRLHYRSADLVASIIPWFEYIQANGIFKALGTAFSNYTPPYTYLLALMTLLPLPALIAIKLISVTMDVINAVLIYKIAQVKYTGGTVPFLAAGIFLCLPTVYLNSAVWGQSDAIYTGFLLLCLYCLLKDLPGWAIGAFAVAFAFKAQAAFIAPLLAVLFFEKRIAGWYFLLVPAVYILLCLPVIALGRSWVEVLTIYWQQGGTYKWLSANAPNLYFFVPPNYSASATWIGLALAAGGLSLWIWATCRYTRPLTGGKLVLAALTTVALAPFLLPRMHERYFYPADVFSLVAAFYWPGLWFLPLTYQIVSGLSYIPFLLYSPSAVPVGIAAAVNTVTLLFLLRQQFQRPNAGV